MAYQTKTFEERMAPHVPYGLRYETTGEPLFPDPFPAARDPGGGP